MALHQNYLGLLCCFRIVSNVILGVYIGRNHMTMSFGKYLRQLRLSAKPKKISQQQLGYVINSTRQYIDAIEKNKGKTAPPRYELLVKLADRLNLSDKQREEFLWLAFKERIRNNWELYKYLHKGTRPTLKGETLQSPRAYSIRLTASQALSEKDQDAVLNILQSVTTDYEVSNLSVNGTHAFLTIGISATDSIEQVIETFKKETKGVTSWQPNSDVQTIGHMPAEWAFFTVAKTPTGVNTN